LDFAPPDVRGHCAVSGEPATAAAPGLVLRSGDGQVLIDLDGDGHEQTGWVLFYLHVMPAEGIRSGTTLAQGAVVGYPSCEGGIADSSHLHLARRYNGGWPPTVRCR
jgi:LasA protease